VNDRLGSNATAKQKTLGLECLEGDNRVRVLDAGDTLHLFVDEVADVGPGIDVEFHQQVIVAGRGIDLGDDFGFGQRIGNLVRLPEFAFDLDEEGGHRDPPICVQSSKNKGGWQGGLALGVPADYVLNSNLVGCPAVAGLRGVSQPNEPDPGHTGGGTRDASPDKSIAR